MIFTGPDDKIYDSLLAVCRKSGGIIPDSSILKLGLLEIPSVLRRFENGLYYHA